MEAGGRIVTFYSFKGGTGRSMQLANVAWILATSGKRVLVVDWDLEAPGLHRYFQPFLVDKQLRSTDGLIDLFCDFTDAALTPAPNADPSWHDEHADFLGHTVGMDWDFPNGGRLDLLPAGRQGAIYTHRVNSFSWSNFYDRLGGGAFLESIKARMRECYDYVLIDSRTGVTDTAGICTVQMPDVLVLCFTANNQGIDGCASVAEAVRNQWMAAEPSLPPKRIIPVVMRIDTSEKDLLSSRRALFRSKFQPYLGTENPEAVNEFWANIEVPYVPWYSYQEVLAPFAEDFSSRSSVLDSAEYLTRLLLEPGSSIARMSDVERARGLAAFRRENGQGDLDVVVLYRPEDRDLVEPLLQHLTFDEALAVWDACSDPDPRDAIARAKSVIVCGGPGGWPDWGELEAIATGSRSLRVLTALLPGSSSEQPVAGLQVALTIDLRDSPEAAFARIAQAVRGKWSPRTPSTIGSDRLIAGAISPPPDSAPDRPTEATPSPENGKGWMPLVLAGAVGIVLMSIVALPYIWDVLPAGRAPDAGAAVDAGSELGDASGTSPDFAALGVQLSAAQAALNSPTGYSQALLSTTQVALAVSPLEDESLPSDFRSALRRTVNELLESNRIEEPADVGVATVVRNYGTGFVAGYASGHVQWFGVDGVVQRAEYAGGPVLDLYADANTETTLAATGSYLARWTNYGGQLQRSDVSLEPSAVHAVFVAEGAFAVAVGDQSTARVISLAADSRGQPTTVALPGGELRAVRRSRDGGRAIVVQADGVVTVEPEVDQDRVRRSTSRMLVSDADLNRDGARVLVVGNQPAAEVYRDGRRVGQPVASGSDAPSMARYLGESILFAHARGLNVRTLRPGGHGTMFREVTSWQPDPAFGDPIALDWTERAGMGGQEQAGREQYIVACGTREGRVVVLLVRMTPADSRDRESAQLTVLLDARPENGSPVSSVRLSRDGGWMVTASEDGGTRLWYLGGVDPAPRLRADVTGPHFAARFVDVSCEHLRNTQGAPPFCPPAVLAPEE